jgi:hypothetical protein
MLNNRWVSRKKCTRYFCKIRNKRLVWVEKVSWFSLQILRLFNKSMSSHLHSWRTAYRNRKLIRRTSKKQIRKSSSYHKRTPKRENQIKHSREWRKNEEKKSWRHNGRRNRKNLKQNTLKKNCETYRWCILQSGISEINPISREKDWLHKGRTIKWIDLWKILRCSRWSSNLRARNIQSLRGWSTER